MLALRPQMYRSDLRERRNAVVRWLREWASGGGWSHMAGSWWFECLGECVSVIIMWDDHFMNVCTRSNR